MEVKPLVATVTNRSDAAVVELFGELNSSGEAALNEAFDAAAHSDLIVLNFSEVDYINSTGIALIVGLLAKARMLGKTVRAFGLIEHYREIFEITRLADFMAICDDETSAVDPSAAPA